MISQMEKVPVKSKDGIEGKSKTIKKKNKRYKKKKDNVDSKPNFVKPKDVNAVSSNWKDLLKSLPKETPKPKGDFRHPLHKFRTLNNEKKKKKVVKEKEAVKKPDIWFDDVDHTLLDPEDRQDDVIDLVNADGNTRALVKEKGFTGLTKLIGMDCEMVGVGHGGTDSILARVSLVNHFGHPVYDKFVAATEKVTDYRTAVSGVRPQDLQGAEDFKTVQKEVSDLLQGRVLVGHALKHDAKVLFLAHPKRDIRDTSLYKPFRAAFGGRTPSLKNLSARMLGVSVQTGEHSSVQDAQAAMKLYTMFRKEWEGNIEAKRTKNINKLPTDVKPKKVAKVAKVGKVGSATGATPPSDFDVASDMATLQKRLQKAPAYVDSDSE